MAYNYLGLVNRLCNAVNEVELDETNFASSYGFYADARNAIKQAINIIYKAQQFEWPFAWDSETFVTTVGETQYSKPATLHKPDWESFFIRKPIISVSSLTSSGTTATATTATAHQLNTGDKTTIRGATPTGYNGLVEVTRTGANTFTYTVEAGLTTPATGTIQSIPDYAERKLTYINYDEYRERYEADDREAMIAGTYSVPLRIVQKANNDYILTPVPDKEYTIYQEGFMVPPPMVDWDDVPEIPEVYEQVIVDKALQYIYMFRDNIEEADRAEKNYTDGINEMRRALIPLTTYMRFQ